MLLWLLSVCTVQTTITWVTVDNGGKSLNLMSMSRLYDFYTDLWTFILYWHYEFWYHCEELTVQCMICVFWFHNSEKKWCDVCGKLCQSCERSVSGEWAMNSIEKGGFCVFQIVTSKVTPRALREQRMSESCGEVETFCQWGINAITAYGSPRLRMARSHVKRSGGAWRAWGPPDMPFTVQTSRVTTRR